MTRLFGLISNDPHALCCALAFLEPDLDPSPATSAGDGWGIGYFQQGRALLNKHPNAPAGAIDLLGELAGHPSDLVLGHIRLATHGPAKLENTHPFRYGQYLFAHIGGVHELARERLVAGLPAFLSRSLVGDTDSELIFMLVLAALRAETGGLEQTAVTGGQLRNALRAGLAEAGEHRAAGPIGREDHPAVLLADGERLAAASLGAGALQYRLVESVPACKKCVAAGRPSRLHHVRFTAVSSSVAEGASGWRPLKQGHSLLVERDMGIEVGAL